MVFYFILCEWKQNGVNIKVKISQKVLPLTVPLQINSTLYVSPYYINISIIKITSNTIHIKRLCLPKICRVFKGADKVFVIQALNKFIDKTNTRWVSYFGLLFT
jgi:hypothetical protein